ncbi:MAG: SpoIIE family protein phosphatase [Alphaproteobacteria bacterium]|nr:SpoIIE family protein phosphatase [Alphaproteobacteria bacterium]
MDSITLAVSAESDVGQVRREALRLAREIGFGPVDTGELAIVATELAANLVRHRTLDGKLTLALLDAGDGRGRVLEIVSTDRGPGIEDVTRALTDYHSTNGTSGCGLGAVRRLVDEFDILSRQAVLPRDPAGPPPPPRGTVITARKWLRQPGAERRIDYSAVSRPYPGETANGDAYLIEETGQGLLIAVADGLGHGPEAEDASQLALAHVRKNREQDFEPLLAELHGVLRTTRGVALTLARLDLTGRTLTHAAVGNVDTYAVPRERIALLARPGVLGYGPAPRPRTNRMSWPDGGTLVLYTDGISAKWQGDSPADLFRHHVTTICHDIMRGFARETDDATVVVARETVT